MWLGVISLFPDMFQAITDYGVVGRAIKQELLAFQCWNPRDFARDKHKSVDDRPYGGGPGMLMMAQPLQDAIQAAKKAANGQVKTIYLSPQGRTLTQQLAQTLVENKRILLVSGRYEGIDERVIETQIDEEWSIGDYVLSGGELPTMVFIDVIARLIPGVLGHQASAKEDSFTQGLLDCPHYTRPELFDGLSVPDVLLSGDHARIARWRLQQSLGRTWLRRPELLNNLALTDEQEMMLAEFIRCYQHADKQQ